MAEAVTAITLAMADMSPPWLRRLARVDPAAVTMFHDNMAAQEHQQPWPDDWRVRSLRVAVFAAATRTKRADGVAQLPVQIGKASGMMAQGENRVFRIIAALRSTEDDELALDELRKRAGQIARYGTEPLRVGDLWRASRPDASASELHALFGAALYQAEQQRRGGGA